MKDENGSFDRYPGEKKLEHHQIGVDVVPDELENIRVIDHIKFTQIVQVSNTNGGMMEEIDDDQHTGAVIVQGSSKGDVSEVVVEIVDRA